jgi:antitoxin (DNA-binding transcriptional repressor) of toxin-antitoxin stability system
MATTHIPVAEAARDLPDILDRVRAGEDIVIEDGSPTAIRLATTTLPVERRTIEDTIARIEARDKERGFAAVMDEDFAADMRQIIANRKPRDTHSGTR